MNNKLRKELKEVFYQWSSCFESFKCQKDLEDRLVNFILADRKAVLERVRWPLSECKKYIADDIDGNFDLGDAVGFIDEALSEIDRIEKE